MRLVISLLVLLSLTLCGLTAHAEGARVNAEVAVDVTGKDSNEARATAMASGEIDGLMDVLSKLTSTAQAKDTIASLDAKKISAIVLGTEVLEEKITGFRYRARLQVSYDGDAIARLVSKASGGAGNVETPAPVSAFLVIPGYTEDGVNMLWEDSNPWRNVWKAVGLETTTGDIIVPYGDASDNALVDAKSLPSANYAALASMTNRYGASDIVVLQASLVTQPDMALNVLKRRITKARNEVSLMTFRADPQETREVLLNRAAREIADKLEQRKNEEINDTRLTAGGEHNKVMLIASNTTLASWTQLRGKLSTLPMVDQIETVAISPRQVDVTVHYRGPPDDFARAIAGSGLRLVQNKDYWIISKD